MTLLQSFSVLLAGIALVIVLTSWLKVHAFVVLFLVSLGMAVLVLPPGAIIPLLKKGFGDTLASIGLIIVLGAIIGVVLDHSGATLSMANFFLRSVGKDRVPVAMSLTGLVTGMTIFCDSGFIVLSGLNRSLTSRSRLNPVFTSSILAISLYSVHCLIPPHPGATAAAGILGVNIGNLVLAGLAVALPSAVVAFIWLRFINRNQVVPDIEPASEENSQTVSRSLPHAGRSFLPILIPLVLITLRSITAFVFPQSQSPVVEWIQVAGDPVIALLVGAVLAFLLFPGYTREDVNRLVTLSIEKAGPILLITAAGGIFGAVIKSTGVGDTAGSWLSHTHLGLLIPFLIAALLKTAQGSSTVAIITAASIMASLTTSLGFTGENGKLLVMLAMGAGSMVISHANDSYFWVVTNFSGLEMNDTLKSYSLATAVMGITALAAVYTLSFVL